jgi:hypothetical protein
MNTNISKYESVSGNPRLELKCECGFAFKTSGLCVHCPSCGLVHTPEYEEYCHVCNCPHNNETARGKNWRNCIITERAKRARQ